LKKFRTVLVVAALLIPVLLFINSGSIPSVKLGGGEDVAPQLNYLTGQEGSNDVLLAVKIDDTQAAHPQIGLQDADLVYVEQVESGLTRLLAIYSSKLPAVIGPVRSARISDIDLLAPFGRIAFAYSGSQTKMRPVLAQANLNNLSAERNPPSIFDRDPDRNGPVNMILYPSLLLTRAVDTYKMDLITLKQSPWVFGEASELAKELNSIKINWPRATYELKWDEILKKWSIYFNNKLNVDSTQQPLLIENAIVQNVRIEDSIYGDKFGGITPLSITTGSGDAYLLRDGKALAIRWERSSAETFTRWMDLEGNDMNLTPGKTWVFLSSAPPVLSYAVN
jgi:hypothetical protein